MSLLIPYSQLTVEQRELISLCNDTDESVFIEGPPWSGKSLIALYSVKNIVEKNNCFSLFMVSNNAMYGYMNIALEELGIRENVTIDTKDNFFWEMAREARISVHLNSDYDENYARILAQLLEEEVDKKYSLVIVSEVQDYLADEWELLKRISERIVCYGDFKQAVYSNKLERDTLIRDCRHKPINYLDGDASTDRLLRVRDYFFNDDEYVASKKESCFTQPLAYEVTYKTLDIKQKDQMKVLIETIKALEGENRTVAIICPNNNNFASLSIYLESHDVNHWYYGINNELRNHDFTSTTPLFISLFNAEGLHFDDVILFGFDSCDYIMTMKRKEDRLKHMLYVGMTRARKTTYILRNEDTVVELMDFEGDDH